MNQITIRGIEPGVERKIRQSAKSDHKSINQVITAIIHKEFGKQAHGPRASTIKELAGGWRSEDALSFEHSISACEQNDEDMWLWRFFQFLSHEAVEQI